MPLSRCPWCESFDLYREYHDREWGLPLWGERALFELLILEGVQAGLSWATILKKRAAYRRAYDGFDPAVVARYGDAKVTQLLADAGIVRNRAKVAASIGNARAYLELTAAHGAFADYLWQFVDGSPVQNAWSNLEQVPATSPQAEAMSRALSKAGFKFVGPTICYAFMQAAGMVNDHLTGCFRHEQVKGSRRFA